MRFSVYTVGRDISPFLRCFDEVVRGIREALTLCGHTEGPPSPEQPSRLIVFGCNMMRLGLPADAIIFNAEQVFSDRNLLNIQQFREHVVWDYSERNVQWLRDQGVRAVLCPVAYTPAMTKPEIVQSAEDTDLLWYGAPNDRRREILAAIFEAKMMVKRLDGVYGRGRDHWIGRARIVLNLHFYEPAIFEVFRVAHLLANKKCVITENGGHDVGLEELAKSACLSVPRDSIVDACRTLLHDEPARRAQAQRGYEVFARTSLADNVRRALAESDL